MNRDTPFRWAKCQFGQALGRSSLGVSLTSWELWPESEPWETDQMSVVLEGRGQPWEEPSPVCSVWAWADSGLPSPRLSTA